MLSFLDDCHTSHLAISTSMVTAWKLPLAVANIALPYFNNLFGFFTYKFSSFLLI